MITRSARKNRKKVLCLGVSYASILQDQQQLQKEDNGVIAISSTSSSSSSPLETTIDLVQRNILTEMDGRDLARCVQTEQECNVDVYTVSQENGAQYRSDRHLDANFNRSNFCASLQRHFSSSVKFDQIILDYYWIPAGWNGQHWNRSFFERTLVNFVKYDNLHSSHESKIFLPFCFYCFKEIMACSNTLLQHYNISFLKQQDLHQIALWRGTQSIDPRIMQFVLGKRIDQEEVYCTFGPRDIAEAMEDPDISKETLLDLVQRLEDFGSIRFIALTPLLLDDDGDDAMPTASTTKNGNGQRGRWKQQEPKLRRGQILGLKSPHQKVDCCFDDVVVVSPPPPPEKQEAKTPSRHCHHHQQQQQQQQPSTLSPLAAAAVATPASRTSTSKSQLEQVGGSSQKKPLSKSATKLGVRVHHQHKYSLRSSLSSSSPSKRGISRRRRLSQSPTSVLETLPKEDLKPSLVRQRNDDSRGRHPNTARRELFPDDKKL